MTVDEFAREVVTRTFWDFCSHRGATETRIKRGMLRAIQQEVPKLESIDELPKLQLWKVLELMGAQRRNKEMINNALISLLQETQSSFLFAKFRIYVISSLLGVGMNELDKEIFLNIFLGKVRIDKKVAPERVHAALLSATGTIIHPTVRNEDVSMQCAVSIATAINEVRLADLEKLVGRAAVIAKENIENRRNPGGKKDSYRGKNRK